MLHEEESSSKSESQDNVTSRSNIPSPKRKSWNPKSWFSSQDLNLVNSFEIDNFQNSCKIDAGKI